MAQGVIDMHSHIITTDFLSSLENEGRLMEEGFPLPKYDAEAHLRWMDESGIQTSVLTLAAPQPTSALTIRKTNETAAKMKKEHPGRFLFCAALPLPDVDAAIREAIYALDTLKADGIKLATNVQGQYLGAPELDTLFAVLNERKAVVILHPHRPYPVNSQVMQQTPLAMQEYLSETTRAVSNMITVLVCWNGSQGGTPFLTDTLPRHDIGVVIQFGDNHFIARGKKLSSVCLRHKIDSLCCATYKDDFLARCGIDEALHLLTRLLVCIRSTSCQRVGSAMYV